MWGWRPSGDAEERGYARCPRQSGYAAGVKGLGSDVTKAL
jgi:hypothetical protein